MRHGVLLLAFFLVGIGSLPSRPANAAEAAPAQPAAPPTQAEKPAIEAPARRTHPNVVVFGGRELIELRGQLGASDPAARARAVEARLAEIVRDPRVRPSAVEAVDRKITTDIRAGDKFIGSVTDGDAKPTGRTRQQLAADYVVKIREALRTELKSTSAYSILLGVVYTLLATGGLVLVYVLMRRLFPRAYARVRSWKDTRIRAVKLQRMTLLSSERLVELIVWIVRAVRVAILLFLLYLYIPTVLSFFPWTRGAADRLFGYISSGLGQVWDGIVGYLPNLLYIAIIVILTRSLVKMVRFFAVELEKETVHLPGFHPEWAMPTFKIVRFLILVLTVVIVFPYLPGSKSPAFQGISIFLGVLLSLGSSSAVSNIVAGVVLTYMRPFRVGDRVKIADTVGDVVDKNLLVTRLRTIKNVDVTIPNAMVLGSHIIDFNARAGEEEAPLILHTTVTIGYDVPWARIHELLIAAAKATPDVLAHPEPFVLQTKLDDFYVHYEVNAFTDQPNRMATTYSVLHQNIQNAFFEAGVEIMSPHYSAVRDGNRAAIPDANLPATYEAPGFRLFSLGDLFEKRRSPRAATRETPPTAAE